MKYKLFSLALLLSLGFDQGSKIWARHALKPRFPESVSVVPGYWDFRYAENTGASFSFMRDSPSAPYLFAVMALVALVAIGFYLRRAGLNDRLQPLALGLVGGGALGNMIDRVAFGRVTDFIVWRVGDHVWPTFNVADAALLVGVIVLLLQPRTRDSWRQNTKPA